jgi:LysR family hydrogen peroxide-inducible transcriptional activator
MNLRDLQYLVALADHRHFGRAAEACFVSQPTLSTQVKKLEAELGVRLVERHPRNVLLTDAGEQIVERARVILAETATIEGIAAQAHDPESGTVRLGLFPTLAPYLLPHVVHRLHERFPRLELLLTEEKTDVILQQLEEGKLDAGVLARPVHEPRLLEEQLFTEDFVLAVPVHHPLADAPEPVDVSILDSHEVLLLEEGHCLRDQALDLCRVAGANERRGFRATSLETLRGMVAAGVGITLLPKLACEPPVPESDDVKLLRFAEPVPRREIAMYSRPNNARRELLPQIAAILRDLPPDLVTSTPPLVSSAS